METIDLADGQRALPLLPINPISPRGDDLPRCRHCASVLVAAHLRCDDGAMLPVYRCPICRHAGTGEPSVLDHQPPRTSHETSDHRGV
jgi:hypothetical protein